MINIDKRALREAAEKAISAGDGNWQTWREVGMNSPEIFTSSGHIVATVNGSFSVVRSDFIAAADPATVLALLDELEESERLRLKFQEVNCELCQKLEAAEKRIADYQELISGLVGVSSSILREVERISNAAAAGEGE